MFKMNSRYLFVLFAMCLSLGTVSDLSAQSRDGRADEPSVGGSSSKAGKTRTCKTLLPKKL